MDHIRLFLLRDEVARFALGQKRFHTGQDLIVLSFGIELLQLRHQAGALGGGVVKEIRENNIISFFFLLK